MPCGPSVALAATWLRPRHLLDGTHLRGFGTTLLLYNLNHGVELQLHAAGSHHLESLHFTLKQVFVLSVLQIRVGDVLDFCNHQHNWVR